MDDNFGIRARREDVPLPLQLTAQFLEVINLSIQHHPDRAIFVAQRLVAAFHIDDAEAPDPKRNRTLKILALIVWPSMNDFREHPLHEDGPVLHWLTAVPTRDSTHRI